MDECIDIHETIVFSALRRAKPQSGNKFDKWRMIELAWQDYTQKYMVQRPRYMGKTVKGIHLIIHFDGANG